MKGEEGSPARADHFSDVPKLALLYLLCFLRRRETVGRGPIIRLGKLAFRNGESGCPKWIAFTNCRNAHTTITKPVNSLSKPTHHRPHQIRASARKNRTSPAPLLLRMPIGCVNLARSGQFFLPSRLVLRSSSFKSSLSLSLSSFLLPHCSSYLLSSSSGMKRTKGSTRSSSECPSCLCKLRGNGDSFGE